MKSKKILLAILAIMLVLGMMVNGCDSGEKDPPMYEPPSIDDNSSVDYYNNLEPVMAVNTNRAIAREGYSTIIGVPDSLLDSAREVYGRASTPRANFSVFNADKEIVRIVKQNGTTCTIAGIKMGSARIIAKIGDQSATIIVAVVPNVINYRLPSSQIIALNSGDTAGAWWSDNRPDSLPGDFNNYKSEPTHQLAWNWRNPGSSYGYSGTTCGIDILAYYVDPITINRRGWVRTTYDFGGWFYNLNGDTNTMTNGVQTNGTVKLELDPQFVYDNGIPYLEITHKLTNTGDSTLTGQKFGASADVMIFDNDRAPLTHLPYGALMTDQSSSAVLPKLKLRLVCQEVQGVDDVTSLWLGTWGTGSHRNSIYTDKRDNVTGVDSALCFSYQNITLNAGETKTFKVRFTQTQ